MPSGWHPVWSERHKSLTVTGSPRKANSGYLRNGNSFPALLLEENSGMRWCSGIYCFCSTASASRVLLAQWLPPYHFHIKALSKMLHKWKDKNHRYQRMFQSTSLNSAEEGHVSLPSYPIISLKPQAFWNRKITPVFTVKKAFCPSRGQLTW